MQYQQRVFGCDHRVTGQSHRSVFHPFGIHGIQADFHLIVALHHFALPGGRRRPKFAKIVGIEIGIGGDDEFVGVGSVLTPGGGDGVQPGFIDFEGHLTATILWPAVPFEDGATESGHAGLVARGSIRRPRAIHMQPHGVIGAAVPPGAIPNDMRAGLGENNVVLQLGVGFVAAGAIGIYHGNATGGALAIGVLYPESIRVTVKSFGFPNHETVLSLQQGPHGVESHPGVDGNHIARPSQVG